MKTYFLVGNTMTTWDIFSMLKSSGPAYVACDGQKYIFQAIEREDGSGRNFNLRLADGNGVRINKYVKTVD